MIKIKLFHIMLEYQNRILITKNNECSTNNFIYFKILIVF